LLLLAAALLGGCEQLSRLRPHLTASLRTDSAEIGVHLAGNSYYAQIGFVFVNTTPNVVSMAGCVGPPMPEVQKLVDGHWVAAYYAVYPACRTMPDFTVPSGGTFRGVVHFSAAIPGHRLGPELLVDSIDGTYRLAWPWTEGTEAFARNARRVEAISNQFRMTLLESKTSPPQIE